jgi:predicted membrane chloride channel (bestrophin family)
VYLLDVAVFKNKTWKQRAAARYKRAVKSGLSVAEATERQARDNRSIDHLATVIAWCAKRGLSVEFVRSEVGMYDPNEKMIHISGRSSPENQLFLLLHECGHVLVEKNGSSHYQLTSEDRSFGDRVLQVAEEIEAWRRGLKLAHRLKIRLDEDAYERMQLSSLRSYFEWVVEPSRFVDDT